MYTKKFALQPRARDSDCHRTAQNLQPAEDQRHSITPVGNSTTIQLGYYLRILTYVHTYIQSDQQTRPCEIVEISAVEFLQRQPPGPTQLQTTTVTVTFLRLYHPLSTQNRHAPHENTHDSSSSVPIGLGYQGYLRIPDRYPNGQVQAPPVFQLAALQSQIPQC